MIEKKTDRNITGIFCLLQASMFCIVAVNTGYFSLMLSKRGYTEEMIGRVATVTSIISLIMPAVVGQLCDRYQMNRLLFVVAAVVAPVAYFCIQRTQSFVVVTIWAALFYALCLGPQSVPAGWIAVLNTRGRNINFGFTRAFGSLSFAVISVVIGVVVERFSMESLPVMLVIFGFFMALAACMLPRPPKPAAEKKKTDGFLPTLKALMSSRPYVLMLIVSMLFSIPGGAYFTYFSVYFSQLGGTESALGVAMFVLAVVEVPVMIFYSRLEKKFGVTWLVALSALGYGLKNLCLSLATSTVAATACLALQVLGLALAVPACQSMIVSCTPVKYSSTAQSLFFSVESIGSIFANVLCTWLVTFTDLRAVFRITSCFAFAGALLFVAGVCLPERKRRAAGTD